MSSKRNLIQYAKAKLKEIVKSTESLAPGELLILRGNTLIKVERLEAFITEDGEVININEDNCISFGSSPLKPIQVKNLIMNLEQSEYM